MRHAAIYLIARGLPGIVAFLAIPLFTRLLDPAGYGKYALVFASISLLDALFFQWLQLSLLRYLPAYGDDPARLKSTILTVAVLLVAAGGVVTAGVCAVPAARGWRSVVFACWLVLVAQAPFELFSVYVRARIEPWRFMGLQLARSSISVVLGASLITAGAGWRGPVVGTAVGMLAPALYAYRRDWASVRLAIDRKALIQICKYGLPLSLTVALAVVIGTSDRFLIAWLKGEDAAGLYSVAVDFTSRTLSVLLMVINTAMFPLAVRAWEHRGREAAQEQMRHNASLLLAVGVPSVVGLAILTHSVAECFLGKRFRTAAADIIPLIALGAFLAGFKAYHFDAAFQFVHQTMYQVWIVLIAAIVNVGLNLLAIPSFGINGAAAASALAYVVSISLTAAVGRKHFALPFPARAFAQVLAATGLMAVTLFPLRAHHGGLALAVQVAIGVAVYGLALIALNFLDLRAPLLKKLLSSGAGVTQRLPGAAPATAFESAQ